MAAGGAAYRAHGWSGSSTAELELPPLTEPVWPSRPARPAVMRPRRPRLELPRRRAAYGFPLQASAPRRARRHTVAFARQWGLDAAVEPAELLVSELMTNAYEASRRDVERRRRHDPVLAAAPLQLHLSLDHGCLRIEVRDHNPSPPVPDDPPADGERGRGLLLVDTFSRRWGFHRLPGGGKAVWCVVAPPSGDPTR